MVKSNPKLYVCLEPDVTAGNLIITITRSGGIDYPYYIYTDFLAAVHELQEMVIIAQTGTNGPGLSSFPPCP